MKKLIVSLLLTGLAVFMLGCSNLQGVKDTQSEDDKADAASTEEVLATKNVIFANEVIMALMREDSLDNSKVLLGLNKYEDDNEALYACYVYCYAKDEDRLSVTKEAGESDDEYAVRTRTYEIESIVDILKEKGFFVLEDYPYCYYNNEELYGEAHAYAGTSKHLLVGECVIVGTYEQFAEVFSGDSVIDNYQMNVALAPRPDYVELMKQCGYTGEEEQGIGVWCDYYYQKILDMVGGKFCTMELQVAD